MRDYFGDENGKMFPKTKILDISSWKIDLRSGFVYWMYCKYDIDRIFDLKFDEKSLDAMEMVKIS